VAGEAEFHCRRALELDPDLPEGHVASAFLLWGPSKNFQHLEAIAELKRALALQNNQPHAYNRLVQSWRTLACWTTLVKCMSGPAISSAKSSQSQHRASVRLERRIRLARDEIQAWRAENPNNKYPVYFALQVALMTGI